MNLDSTSACGKNSKRANLLHTKFNVCIGFNYSTEKNQKGSEKNRKNLGRQMIQTTNVRNEKKKDANLKITSLKSFQSQIKITRNGESNYIFSKRVSRAS